MAPARGFEAELNLLLGKETNGWQATQAHQFSTPMSHFSALTPPVIIQENFGTPASGGFNGDRNANFGWEMDVGPYGEQRNVFKNVESMCHSQGTDAFANEFFLTKPVCDDVLTPNLDVLLKLLGGINDPCDETMVEKSCRFQTPTAPIPNKRPESQEKHFNQTGHDTKFLIENAFDFSFLQDSNLKRYMPRTCTQPAETVGNMGKATATTANCNFQNHFRLTQAENFSECHQADFHPVRAGLPNSVKHSSSAETSFSDTRSFGSKPRPKENKLPDAFSQSSNTSAPLTPVPSPQSSGNSPASFIQNRSKFSKRNYISKSSDSQESPNAPQRSFVTCPTRHDRTELHNDQSAACQSGTSLNVAKRYVSGCSNCGAKQTSLWRRGSNGERVCNACGLYRKVYMKERPASMASKLITRRRRKKTSTKIAEH